MSPHQRITASDAARILGVRIESVRRFIDDGTLDGIKPGGRWLVLRREVEALAASRAEFKSDYLRSYQRLYMRKYRARQQRERVSVNG